MKNLSIIIFLNVALLMTACKNNEINSDNEFSESSVTDYVISETKTQIKTQPSTQPETKPVNLTLSDTFGDTIVDRIYLTMPKNKVFAVTGENYDDTFCWGKGLDNYYEFYIDSFDKLGFSVEVSANFGFDENNNLHSFYYSIGYDKNDNCIYSAEEIDNIYNKIINLINEKYGEYYYSDYLEDINGNKLHSLPFYEWFTDYGFLKLEGNNIDGNNYASLAWYNTDDMFNIDELGVPSEYVYQKFVSFCHEYENCPNLSPCRVHDEAGTYENKSDGIIGDNDGNGVIDESDWEEEWKNYLDEKLN